VLLVELSTTLDAADSSPGDPNVKDLELERVQDEHVDRFMERDDDCFLARKGR